MRFFENQHRAATLTVLRGDSDDPIEVIKARLQIAMRLRNNLSHGVKWQYRLHDQLENFSHANAVLMTATDFSPPTP